MRRVVPLTAIVTGIACTLVGCSGTGPAVAHRQTAPPRPYPRASLVRSAGAPRCTTAAAAERSLVTVHPVFVGLPENPFGVASSTDGRWTFVSGFGDRTGAGGAGPAGGIEVLSEAGSSPHAIRTIATKGPPLGEAMTHDGKYLLAADGSGAVVVSASQAEQGSAGAVAGYLSVPADRQRVGGAIEVVVSPDDRFAFVSLEGSAEIAVFNLAAALAHGFGGSSYVGAIPTDEAPVGMAISPDGRWLYSTSELGRGGTQRGGGTLRVIELREAEADPSRSVVARVTAGCGPVRVAVAPDGDTVWVTARESDALLGFSAAKLTSDPAHALVADVRVGQAPVGLALVDHGRRIVVCDSNRFLRRGSESGLSVVDTDAALAGRPALLGAIRAGGFPRDETPTADGRELLVANFGSHQLEVVNAAALP